VPILWSVILAISGWFLSTSAADDRRVVLGAAVLTLSEVAIVTAIALVFSSFSSPFLTAIFTFGLFIVGRSADTLARLPERYFGPAIHAAALWLSKVVPNMMLYVPPRSLLTGEAAGVPLAGLTAWQTLMSRGDVGPGRTVLVHAAAGGWDTWPSRWPGPPERG
jgi:hypothetical protein